MTKLIGRLAWTELDGLCAPEVTLTSRVYGDMIHAGGTIGLGALNTGDAAPRVNPVMLISLPPV